jgi:hypothetical protein
MDKKNQTEKYQKIYLSNNTQVCKFNLTGYDCTMAKMLLDKLEAAAKQDSIHLDYMDFLKGKINEIISPHIYIYEPDENIGLKIKNESVEELRKNTSDEDYEEHQKKQWSNLGKKLFRIIPRIK